MRCRRRLKNGRASRIKGLARAQWNPMKITLISICVDDQYKALPFYTEVLGFVKKADFSCASVRTGQV